MSDFHGSFTVGTNILPKNQQNFALKADTLTAPANYPIGNQSLQDQQPILPTLPATMSASTDAAVPARAPPQNPAVLHYYEGPCTDGCGMFICPIGHRFRFNIRKANKWAERYEGYWVITACVTCAPVFFLAGTTKPIRELLGFLRTHALSPPDTTPRSIYRPAPASAPA